VLERSTRDVVFHSSYLEIIAGSGTPHGGVSIDVSHFGASFVEQQFPGLTERCRDVGFDLTREPVNELKSRLLIAIDLVFASDESFHQAFESIKHLSVKLNNPMAVTRKFQQHQ